MKLNRFEEAITWCDKGLAVSLTHKLFLDMFFICSVSYHSSLSSPLLIKINPLSVSQGQVIGMHSLCASYVIKFAALPAKIY